MGLSDEEPPAPVPRKRKKKKQPPLEAKVSDPFDAPAGVDGGSSSGTELGTKLASALSLAAAIVIAVVGNIWIARHYDRWDLTKSGDFTLSPGTVETLQNLDSEVLIFVLMPRADPTAISVAEMLDTYAVHTDKLRVEFVDPDRDQPRLFELRKQYGLIGTEAGGRVTIDAALVIVKGAHHRYVLASELYKVEDAEDMRVRPRLEIAITSAVRQVRAEKRSTVCFTAGHGELPLEVGGLEGMAEHRNRLITNNYDVATVFDGPEARALSLSNCTIVVVAAPRAPFAREHADALKSYIESGGSAFIVVWPVPDAARKNWVKLGLDEVILTAGVRVHEDLVIEGEPGMRGTRGDGTIFFATSVAHPITARLMAEESKGVTASMAFASSLEDAGTALKPEALLRTTPRSFGVNGYWNRTEPDRELVPTTSDNAGPLTIATATERPPIQGQRRGSRVVVVTSATPLWGATLSEPELYGTSLFTDGVISWLAGHEQFLDIPDKPIKTNGLRLTEDAITRTLWYVVVIIPLVTMFSGILIFLMRRSRRARPVTKET